ncbi:hypothetical protein [Streptomyces sp. NRRL B-3648]|uniref:hypothetical protein n=1 Tax=Streptomyces sp. NRRL B-3648 TaxID=1519493 RepID=UPI000AA6080C|nr:hypothetical protein [Streptomyces sp. NRRL B-3648]
MGAIDDLAEVLRGQCKDLRWVVRAGLVKKGVFVTHLDVFRADRLIDSGGGSGPAVLDSLVDFSYGYSHDAPMSVVARCSAEIDRLVAVTDDDREVVMTLSDPAEQFGVRFAACILPSGTRLARVYASSRDDVVFESAVRAIGGN